MIDNFFLQFEDAYFYKFEGYSMNEEQACLAIHELEELSYKELEKCNENS